MISTRHNFIYLHVPKTGGNAIQSILEPLSDDHRVATSHQDGLDRFDIVGPVTPRKHATLAEYASRLGRAVDNMKVVIGSRHPIDRLVSAYFSPHRWFIETEGRWEKRPAEWDLGKFLILVHEVVPAINFLKVDGKVRVPDFIFRFEHLQSDFDRFILSAEIPLAQTELPYRNVSSAPSQVANIIRDDKEVLEAVERFFAEDFEFFGYKI